MLAADRMEIAELFEQGGHLMWAILAASVVGVAVFFERLWSLQRGRILPRAFVDRIRGMVSKGKTSEAQLLCEENGSSIALIMAGALRAYRNNKDRAACKEAVEEVGNREVAQLDRNVEIVGTVASITPLLGLLGTVIGMILVFKNFVEAYNATGKVTPDVFAGGIGQALVTTAFGLTVAIPMLVAYKFLQGRNDRLVVAMEEDAMGIVDLLEDGRAGRSSREPERGREPRRDREPEDVDHRDAGRDRAVRDREARARDARARDERDRDTRDRDDRVRDDRARDDRARDDRARDDRDRDDRARDQDREPRDRDAADADAGTTDRDEDA